MLAYKFDWSVLWRQPYGEWLLGGIWLTLQLGFVAWIIALVLGVFLGTIRVSPWPWLRFLGTLYVEVLQKRSLFGAAFFLVLCRAHALW